MTQKATILKALQERGVVWTSDFTYPAASVRRALQELIHEGWPISFSGYNGAYRLAQGAIPHSNVGN